MLLGPHCGVDVSECASEETVTTASLPAGTSAEMQ